MLAKWIARTARTAQPWGSTWVPNSSRMAACAVSFRNTSTVPQSRWVPNDTRLSADLSSSRTHALGHPASGHLVLSDAQRKTIYALSTPPGKAGVAVIRVSGPDALHIWHSMVSMTSRGKGKARAKTEKPEEKRPEPWRMYRCEVVHPETQELLDSGLAVYFKGASEHKSR